MKKVYSILFALTFAAFCFVITGSTAYAFSMHSDELQDIIDAAPAGSTIEVDLTEFQGIDIDGTVEIDDPITIIFKTGSYVYCGSTWGLRAFDITSNDVHLDLSNLTFRSTFKPADKGGVIYITGDNCSVKGGIFEETYAKKEGGAIYIDGENVTVSDAEFIGCRSDNDGGAIFVADTDDIIKDCTFKNCYAKGNGGAIGLHSSWDDNLKIIGCTFENCSAGGDGQWVDGADDTTIINCTKPYDNNYYECEFSDGSTGSVISGGQAGIIIAVLVVAIAAVVVLLLVKRKRNKA